jgi:hypothetical protein
MELCGTSTVQFLPIVPLGCCVGRCHDREVVVFTHCFVVILLLAPLVRISFSSPKSLSHLLSSPYTLRCLLFLVLNPWNNMILSFLISLKKKNSVNGVV